MHSVQRDFCILVFNSYFSVFVCFFFPSESSLVRKVYGNLLEMQVPPKLLSQSTFYQDPTSDFICLLKLLTYWTSPPTVQERGLLEPLCWSSRPFHLFFQRWWGTSGHHLSYINFCGIKDDLGASEPFGFKLGNWSLYNLFPHREDYFLDYLNFFFLKWAKYSY